MSPTTGASQLVCSSSQGGAWRARVRDGQATNDARLTSGDRTSQTTEQLARGRSHSSSETGSVSLPELALPIPPSPLRKRASVARVVKATLSRTTSSFSAGSGTPTLSNGLSNGLNSPIYRAISDQTEYETGAQPHCAHPICGCVLVFVSLPRGRCVSHDGCTSRAAFRSAS